MRSGAISEDLINAGVPHCNVLESHGSPSRPSFDHLRAFPPFDIGRLSCYRDRQRNVITLVNSSGDEFRWNNICRQLQKEHVSDYYIQGYQRNYGKNI